ncbi:MAG: hypothetical protein J4N98_08250 [Chloroflexi bacterium]|nr:hypothetical protein [Chloroflexota bacterium]
MKNAPRALGDVGPSIVAVIVGAALIGGQIAFVYSAWPTTWTTPAQATLAAAFITLSGTILASVGKFAFDSISLQTTHKLAVREKMLDRFYDYAGNYLVPFAAASGELAKYLDELLTAPHDLRKQSAGDGVLFATAQYVSIHSALVGTFSLPNVDRPLGLLLRSRAAEIRVWKLVIPPWALGVSTLEMESALIGDLHMRAGQMRPPTEFLALSRVEGSALNRLRRIILQALSEDPVHTARLMLVLRSLNLLLNYEMSKVYAAWYSDSEAEPTEILDAVADLPDTARARLGIDYEVAPNRLL